MRLMCLAIVALGLVACHSLDFQHGRQAFAAHRYVDAFDYLLVPAKHGDAYAQYAIGYMYYYGFGVPQDVVRARDWLVRSAKGHNHRAELALRHIDRLHQNILFVPQAHHQKHVAPKKLALPSPY